MGRTNHSYNGMLSAIARKSLPRFTNYAKDTASLSTIFGNEYSTINKRGNDSLTNIISTVFNTPEEYIKETNVGPIITLNGDRTVTVIADEDYSDLGATADGGETVTVDTSNLDTSAVGTYTVSYSATDTTGYTRVENRFVNVVAPTTGGGSISSWTLKDTISDPYGFKGGFAFGGSASISGDGAWISIGSQDDGVGPPFGHGNVFMYSKNTDITYSKTQDIAGSVSEYYFGQKTKISRDGNYLCVLIENSGYGGYFQMFKRTNNTWNSITSTIQLFNTNLTDLALSEDGTYIVISNNSNVDTVKVYIKSADDTSVTLMTNINPPEDSPSGYRSVSISDNGELLCFSFGFFESNTGNVYVYTRTSSSWSTNPTAVIQGPETGGYFGYSVSMSGDGNFIAVGAPILDNAYIYKRSGSSWSLSSTINGPSNYAYGFILSLSQYADYLAVGSFYASGVYIGDHVYAYYKDANDAWTLVQTIAGDTGTNFGDNVNISSEGNYILVTADQATANAYVYYGTGGNWTPGYTTVSVTLGDKLQPNVSSLTLGQKYVFDFSQTRGNGFNLSLDGTTELTDGVIEAENTLVYTVPSDFNLPLYYYSPNTPNIGGYFWIYNVVYFVLGILKIGGVTSITRGQTYTFYFSSEYGTTIALSITEDGTDFTEGVTTTDTSLTFVVPVTYASNTIYIKSPTTAGIGSSLAVTGAVTPNHVYFDANGILRASGITSITIGQTYTFYFSSDYGTRALLALTEDGDTFEEGVTSNLATSLTFALPNTYSLNTIYIKSLTTEGIGSSLSVTGSLDYGVIYFDNGVLKATGITELERGNTYTFYYSSDYGTRALLALTEDGDTFEEGVTSNLATSLTFALPNTYSLNTIYIKSLTTEGIGSSLSVTGSLDYGVIYFDNGILKASGITELERGNTYTFYYSSDYGTRALLALTEDGDTFEEGVTSNLATSLTFALPNTYSLNTIYIKSLTTEGIGSSLSVTGSLDYGVIYFDNGILKASGITELERGNTYTFYYSSDYGTRALLAFTEDGDTFEEGVTSNLATSLTFALPNTYGLNNIYIKSPTTSGIGSSLTVSGAVTPNHVYFDANGILRASGITSIIRGQTYTFYYSSDYGTRALLAFTEDGDTFEEGVTSNLATSLTFVVPTTYASNTIYIKSPTTSGIGSSLTVSGTLDDGTVYFDNGILRASGITSITRGQTYTFYFSSDYGTTIALSITEDGTDFTEGVTTTDTSLTFVVPVTYASNTIYIKSPTISGIGSSLSLFVRSVVKLLASDGADIDYFGTSVSISSDGLTAIVGARGDDDKGSFSGSAYIFNYDNISDTWTQTTKLLASDGEPFDYLGFSVTISGDGLTAIVGVYGDDDNGSFSGSAYIFNYANGTWTQTTKLLASDGAPSDYFGYSVSISNDGLTAIVGAYRDDDNGSGSGSAYIFNYANGTWTQTTKLLASDGAPSDFFSISVSISNDGLTAIVGAYLDDDDGSNSGSAYIFNYDNISDTWTQTKLLASDAAPGDTFGTSVSISNDGLTAIVGAYGDDDNGSNSGSAYIFNYDNISDTWTQTKLLASDGAPGDQFGKAAVSISGDGLTAIVGSSGDDDNGSNSGSAYIFNYDNISDTWTQTKLLASDRASGDSFGNSLSISNDGLTAIVGAVGDDSGKGSVYIIPLL